MVFAILQMTFVSLVIISAEFMTISAEFMTISAEFMTIPASAETNFGDSCRKARASAPSDTSVRVGRYEPANVVTALAVMHFTLLRIMAGRVGALSRNFSGMVGASSVVVEAIGTLAGRVGALAVMVGAQAGAISAVLGLV